MQAILVLTEFPSQYCSVFPSFISLISHSSCLLILILTLLPWSVQTSLRLDPENIERLGPESLAQAVLCQSSLLKSTYHLHSFQGETGQSQQEAMQAMLQREHRISQVCHRLSAQWLCDWQPAKLVPAFRWETKFHPYTTGPQGKSQTCLTLNNEEQSASSIMPSTWADGPAWQCYWFVSFLSTTWWYLAFFKFISCAFFPLHGDISFPITHIHSF